MAKDTAGEARSKVLGEIVDLMSELEAKDLDGSLELEVHSGKGEEGPEECEHCGAEVEEAEEICPHCGEPMEKSEHEAPEKE